MGLSLYRAVDRDGQTVDFRLSRRRNVAAAKAFLRKAMRSQATAPTSITLDGYAASHRAVRELQEQDEMPKTAKLRSSKYLNNVIEQDHRNIKLRLASMLGFKQFKSAAIANHAPNSDCVRPVHSWHSHLAHARENRRRPKSGFAALSRNIRAPVRLLSTLPYVLYVPVL